MNEEVEILGFRVPKKDVLQEDGSFTVFGALLIGFLTYSVFKWMCDHPDKVKEILNERRKVCLR